jgi:hypothetical protein
MSFTTLAIAAVQQQWQCKKPGFSALSTMPTARKTAAPLSAKIGSAKLLISVTLSVCGEVAEGLKAAVC